MEGNSSFKSSADYNPADCKNSIPYYASCHKRYNSTHQKLHSHEKIKRHAAHAQIHEQRITAHVILQIEHKYGHNQKDRYYDCHYKKIKQDCHKPLTS